MSPLAPHPIGIKYWTGIWQNAKSLSVADAQAAMNSKFMLWSHRNMGQYYYLHRAGRAGIKAPIVALFAGVKLFSMAYATYRDRECAVQVAGAYGQSGVNVNATPK